jgi:hypothetical protein
MRVVVELRAQEEGSEDRSDETDRDIDGPVGTGP